MGSKHRRGPWSQAEDSYLIQLVQSQGAHNWVRISQLIQSRSPKQCRERFHQNLKPSLNLSPITPEEGILIERMVAEMGKRWAEIARRLNGRSDNAIKNWWNGGVNRRKRMENRRADAVSRQHHSGMLTQPRQPSYAQQAMGNQLAAAAASYAQSYDQRPLPYPINTSHLRPPMQRRTLDTPLPSPSAMSNISRTDSSEGAPPSLVSDAGTYSAYSASPGMSPNTHALPPIHSSFSNGVAQQPFAASTQALYQQQQAQQQVQQRQQWPANDLDFSAQYSKAHAQAQAQAQAQVQDAQYQQYYFPSQSDWSSYTTGVVVPSQRQRTPPNAAAVAAAAAQGQLPLPKFDAHFRSTLDQPSPPRDNPMNLSKVLV